MFLLLFFLNFEGRGLDMGLTLSAITEDSDTFLESPSDLAFDSKGNIYLLDLSAKTIFVWDKAGKYLKNIGQAGEGPGEFVFNSRVGGPQGYLNIINDQLFVYDGGPRHVSIFDKNHEYKESRTIKLEVGRTERFRFVNEDTYLIFVSSYFSEEPYRKVATYSKELKELAVFMKAKDNTWHYTNENGRRQVVLHAYDTAMKLAYNHHKNEIIVGNSDQPTFSIFDLKAKLKQVVHLKLSRHEITKEDKDEWNNQRWFKSQNFFQVKFPDEKAYYDAILPIGDKFLAYLQSPAIGRIEGILVNRKGETLKKFKMKAGNGGNLLGANGRVFAAFTDEDGDYNIKEVTE